MQQAARTVTSGYPSARRLRAARQSAPRRAAAQPFSVSASVAEGTVGVVLLSGGVGKRMGASIPKQYLELRGEPIATYSLRLFCSLPEVGELVVVCAPEWKDVFEKAYAGVAEPKPPLKFALPGEERQDSVFNGLSEVSEGMELACVHDSARPLVTPEEVRAVLSDASEVGAAVLGVPCKATVKEADPETGMVVKTLDRSTLWEMHTPQVIRPALLREGFALVRKEGLEVTDDVSIVEALGHPVRITQGSYENLKVTTPEDLLIADKLLLARE